jgi:type VI secretion system VasD/TssJ family lipoprotein
MIACSARNVLVAVVLAGVAAGCPKPGPAVIIPPPPPPPCATPEALKVNLQASPLLNPGEKGEALATVVRFYQLKTQTTLLAATFDEILDRDKEALGEDLVGVSDVTINPGDKIDPPVARKPDASFLAVVALFRKPVGTSWRVVKKMPMADPDHCRKAGQKGAPPPAVMRFLLDENRIELR